MNLGHCMNKSGQILQGLFIKTLLLACAVLFLAVLAWWALNGGILQISRAQTFGQQAETILQLSCGLLSILVVITSFRLRRYAKWVRISWGISFVLIGTLSPLVWGPPMPLISLLFAAMALLVTWIVIWALRKSLGNIQSSGFDS